MKQKIKFVHNAKLQETRKTAKKRFFSDFQDCIAESYRFVSIKIGSTM